MVFKKQLQTFVGLLVFFMVTGILLWIRGNATGNTHHNHQPLVSIAM